MDNAGYVGLTRLKGLGDELRAVANNVANVSTTGYRAERLVFAEVMVAADTDGGGLSMASPRAHWTDTSPGGFRATGSELDLAIQGDGFFQVLTPDGPRLTRAGNFQRNADGAVVSVDGHPLLDAGGGPVAVPADARQVAIGRDGTISADGQQVGRIGLFTAPPETLLRETGVLFRSSAPLAETNDGQIAQGFLEESNVSPVGELSRMIEVQRAYELSQNFLSQEDERLAEAVRVLGRSS